ncbi:MAG TPA: phosphoadenylyl-sulfate reductase [Candidatus Saccharimonadales bacterium]|nr:phosphoadenylyl-sulfate reductase [Candidatus Saccharimonadales bacterium]
MTYKIKSIAADIARLNNRLDGLSPEEIIRWADRSFAGGLYAASSFGAESALLLSAIKKTGISIPIVTIDTGFWFPETHEFMDRLADEYGLDIRVFSPDKEDIKRIDKTFLWTDSIESYNRITKLEPMSRAAEELGIRALLSGARRYQTAGRSRLRHLEVGNDGEIRIYPFIDWTREEVEKLFRRKELPRHPLYDLGYESIGDWTITRPGTGRDGRNLGIRNECGLHILPGSNKHFQTIRPTG